MKSSDSLNLLLRGDLARLLHFDFYGDMSFELMKQLLWAVQHNQVLETLKLRSREPQKGREVAPYFQHMLRTNKSLSRVSMGAVVFRKSEVESILEAAASHPRLKHLYLTRKIHLTKGGKLTKKKTSIKFIGRIRCLVLGTPS